jgi:hypothetical protein
VDRSQIVRPLGAPGDDEGGDLDEVAFSARARAGAGPGPSEVALGGARISGVRGLCRQQQGLRGGCHGCRVGQRPDVRLTAR